MLLAPFVILEWGTGQRWNRWCVRSHRWDSGRIQNAIAVGYTASTGKGSWVLKDVAFAEYVGTTTKWKVFLYGCKASRELAQENDLGSVGTWIPP